MARTFWWIFLASLGLLTLLLPGRASVAHPGPRTSTLPLSEGFESGPDLLYSEFLSDVPVCAPGGCGWTVTRTDKHSGVAAAYAPAVGGVADQRLVLANAVAVPVDATAATLEFWQRYDFPGPDLAGGVLELSTDAGQNWQDLGANVLTGGYTGQVGPCCSNPLAGRAAWTGTNGGAFTVVTVDLLGFAGQNVTVRLRAGTGAAATGAGWWVDDIRLDVQAPQPCGPATWTARAAYPLTIDYSAVAAQGGRLYSFGGNTTGGTTAAAAVYDPATDSWTALPPLPVALNAPAAVSDGRYLYVLGGAAAGGPSASLYRYDPTSGAYTTLAPSPTAAGFHGAAYLDGKIYRVAGLTAGGFTGRMDVYTVATNQWVTAAPYPLTVFNLIVVVTGGYLYGAGGWDGSAATAKAYRYDPAHDRWDDAGMADLPGPRSSPAGGMINGRLIVAGGFGRTGGLTGSTVAWDPRANRWASIAQMGQPRSYAGSAVLGSSLLVVGGTGYFSETTTDLQEYAEPPCASPTPAPATPAPTPPASPTPVPRGTPPGCPLPFVDVPVTAPFYPYIECLVCGGVASGYDCGGAGEPCPGRYFRPAALVTRAQLGKLVVGGAAIADPIPAGRQTFEDVPPTHPFWLFVERLAGRGAISGYGCGAPPAGPCVAPGNRPYFLPGGAASRGELVKIAAGAAGYQDPGPLQVFEDVPATNAFFRPINWAAGHAVVSGYVCGQAPAGPCIEPGRRPYFLPFTPVVRGQAAKIVRASFSGACTPP